MTDAEALLLAILDDPDDDLPRLAYADWLEEQGGDESLAGAVRLMLPLARLRGGEHADWHGRRLTCPPGADGVVWLGGVVADVTCTLRNWFIHRAAMVTSCPACRVTLSDRADWIGLEDVNADIPRVVMRERSLGWGSRYMGHGGEGDVGDQVVAWAGVASPQQQRHAAALAAALRSVFGCGYRDEAELDAALSLPLLAEARAFAKVTAPVV